MRAFGLSRNQSGRLQIIGPFGALLYQLIWPAHLFEHPEGTASLVIWGYRTVEASLIPKSRATMMARPPVRRRR